MFTLYYQDRAIHLGSASDVMQSFGRIAKALAKATGKDAEASLLWNVLNLDGDDLTDEQAEPIQEEAGKLLDALENELDEFDVKTLRILQAMEDQEDQEDKDEGEDDGEEEETNGDDLPWVTDEPGEDDEQDEE